MTYQRLRVGTQRELLDVDACLLEVVAADLAWPQSFAREVASKILGVLVAGDDDADSPQACVA